MTAARSFAEVAARYTSALRVLEEAAAELHEVSLQHLAPAARPAVQIVQRVVAAEFRMPIAMLWCQGRHEPVATARLQAMTITRELLGLPLEEVAFSFGRRDHATVFSAMARVRALSSTSTAYRLAFEQLRERCLAALRQENAA